MNGDDDFTEAEGKEAFELAQKNIHSRQVQAVAEAIEGNMLEAARLTNERKHLADKIEKLADMNGKLREGDAEAVRQVLQRQQMNFATSAAAGATYYQSTVKN